MKHFFLMIIVIFTLTGCNQDNIETKNEIINIDLEQLGSNDLPDLKVESIVHLETSDSSLIGYIDRIEIHNEKIYILDASKSISAFAFYKDGTFIRKTKYGRGPGELIHPYDLYLDKESNFVYVYDYVVNSIMKYSSTLEYLNKEKFDHPVNNFATLENDRMLINTHFYQDFVYKILGSDNKTVEHEFLPDIEYSGGLSIFRSISKNKRILLIAQYHYDIYELKDNQLHSVYYVDFGKFKLTKEDVEQKGMMGSYKLTTEGKRVSSLNDISEGESFLSFRVYFKSEALDFAYSFKEQKPILINEYVGKNMLPACTVRGITEDDLFYAVVEPEDLDNFQKETGKLLVEGEIDPESNPYIITFKLDELVDN